MMGKLGAALNAACLVLYGIGLTAVGTFFTNTRLVGIRDSRWKSLILLVGLAVWPLAGAGEVLAGGPSRFFVSLLGPFGWRWAWRMTFTLNGARYLRQEIYRHNHPRPRPTEVTNRKPLEMDMRAQVAAAERLHLRGLKRLAFRTNELYDLEVSRYEVRLDRRVERVHPDLARQVVRLPCVAGAAGSDDVRPVVGATA